MKDIISGVALGTLVRQMMCGIVFFIPVVLWNQNSNWDSIVQWLQSWNTPGLVAFGIVAACIGTLIYHVEKNLWAYAWQTLRICKRWKGRNFVYIFSCLMMLSPLAMLLPCDAESTASCGLIVITFMLAVFFPVLMLIKPCKRNLRDETQKMWKASSKLPENLDADIKHAETNNSASITPSLRLLELYELKEVARREAGWADYIHCGQTSAFAWILGCLLVMANSVALPECGFSCCCCDCSMAPSVPIWLLPSIWGAIWLLGFEMLCEVHKQKHIDSLLADYEKLKNEIGAK